MRKIIPITILLALLMSPALIATAQEGEGDEEKLAAELPDNAIWRFGEVGKQTQMNGYNRIAFSPDGSKMVVRNRLNLVSLIDVESREVMFEFKGYEEREWVLNFDFSPNSKYFLTASEGNDERVSVWNAETGELHLDLPTPAKSAFFRNDKEVCLLNDQEVAVYDIENGTRIKAHPWSDRGDMPLANSRQGDVVVSQRRFGKVAFKTQVYDVRKKTKTILSSPSSIARTVVVSNDGNWLAATFNRNKEVRLWDLRNPHKKTLKLEAHIENAQSVSFSPDSRFIATTGWDSEVYVWDVLTAKLLGKLSGHSEHVNSCAFSPHDFLLATGASGKTDSSILVWDYRDLVFPAMDPEVAERTFEDLWSQLSDLDHRKSLSAVDEIVKGKDDFLEMLNQKLGIVSAGNSTDKIRDWITQLDSKSYRVRKEAEENLKKSRMRAEEILKEELKNQDVVREVRYRIERILNLPVERPKISENDQIRLHRAIFALELIGNEAAMETLQNIAESHNHIDIARDASSSLHRVKFRLGR